MATALDELFRRQADMELRFTQRMDRADAKHELHLLECSVRYGALKADVGRGNRATLWGFAALTIVAIGLKTKFAEEFLRLLGLL